MGKITMYVHQCQRKHYVCVVKTLIILKVSDFQLFLLSSVYCKLENFENRQMRELIKQCTLFRDVRIHYPYMHTSHIVHYPYMHTSHIVQNT